MKIKHVLTAFSAGIILFSTGISNVYAATYSSGEVNQVRKYQTEFHKLDRATNYDQKSMFRSLPNFASPFSPGVLVPSYIQTSIEYVNYYRSLVGLPSDANSDHDNYDAQLGAASLAAVDAKTSLTAHGLIGYRRPNYISEQEWHAAQLATLGNVNFLESTMGATAGEVVTDLVQDKNNIAGSGNTGHRALILSARATRMGIGAAYGRNNGKLYSVQNGIFADDILRTPVKQTVTYPAEGVFPYELANSDTPWSVYFASKIISRTPKVTITDLTTGKRYSAKYIRNFGRDYYGMGYSSAITFRPDRRLKIINTHKYRVQIKGIYSYSFRLFRQDSYTALTNNKSHPKTIKNIKKHRH